MSSASNRCCTFPQGDASILPQILALMAAVSTLMAFPVFDFTQGTEVRDFLCIEYIEGEDTSTPEDECFPLKLNTDAFWDVSSEDSGWAAAIQAAAVFGIFACVAGVMAFLLLLSASCFALKPRRLILVLVLQGVAFVLALLTLVAGVADVCTINISNGDSVTDPTPCSTESVRVEEGAGFMIAGAILHLAALVLTILFFCSAKKDAANMSGNKDEVAPLADPGTHQGHRTVQTTINPDGTETTRTFYRREEA